MTTHNANSKVHIGLSWHSFVSANLGVGALTAANMELIGRAAEKAGLEPEFHIMGVREAVDYSDIAPWKSDFANIGYKGIANPNSQLAKAMRQCDLVFDIGGGDSFTDIYPMRRFGLIILSKWLAKISGTPLILSPQTIGPFKTAKGRILARGAAKLAKQIFVRDEMSMAALRDLLPGAEVSANAVQTTDVAFALPFEQLPKLSASDGKRHIGINISALLYKAEAAKGSKLPLTLDYRQLVHDMLDRLTSDANNVVHLVPHVLAEHLVHEDDYAQAEELQRAYPALVLPKRFHSPVEAKTYIAQLDLLIGSRMHATIAGISSSTPVLPLGYSRKFSGLYETLGYPYNVDMTSQSAEDAMAMLDTILSDLDGAAAAARAGKERALSILANYVEALEAMFAQMAAERAPEQADGK